MREGWQHIKFADAFYLNMGKTPARADSTLWENGIYPWVSISDIPEGKYVGPTKELLSQKAVDTTHIHLVPKGTVIMSFKLTIGKTAIAPFDLYTNEAIMAFEPKPDIEILPDFLYYYLRFYRWSGNRAVMGETINKGVISEAYADIPPLDEQQRIVSELDRLASIISDKQQQLRELDNLSRVIFYDMFGDPLTNPKGWEMKKLGDIGNVITGSTPSTKDVHNYDSQDKCFIKPSDIASDNVSMLMDSEFYISDYAFKSSRRLPKGAVLTTCIGSIGKVGILECEATCNQQINAITPNTDLVLSLFLGYSILLMKQKLIAIANAPVVPIMNKTQFSEISLPLPPLDLQQQFAEKVQTIEEQKDVLKQSIAEFENLLAQRMELHFA